MYRLNPFVQVFYSNRRNDKRRSCSPFRVLIPLFRSFILITVEALILGLVQILVLIPLFRSFILMGIDNEWIQLGRKKVLIPLFRSFILISCKQKIRKQQSTCLNPFVQVFYSNLDMAKKKKPPVTVGLNPFVQVFYSNGFCKEKILPKMTQS